MATVTSLAGGTLPAWTSSTTTRYGRDNILTETSASYSWTSSSGHKVVLLGSFTYPGGAGTDPTGTVDQALFDISNDGTTDLTITFASPKSIVAASLFDLDSGLMGFLLEEADTLTLAGTTDTNGTNSAFHANGSALASLTNQASDNLTITGAGLFTADNDGTIADGVVIADDTVTINSTLGTVSVSGDVYDLGSFGGASVSNTRTITYGNDTFVDTSTQSALTHIVVGDLFDTSPNSDFFILNFGNDTVTGGANSLEVFGDALGIDGSDLDLNGGADSIIASDQGDVIVGDVDSFSLVLASENNAVTGGADTVEAGDGDDLVIGDVRDLGELNTLTAGDDSIQGGADNDTLIGDAQEIGTNSIFSGGDDQMSGGTGDDLLIGDYETAVGAVVASGGNDTLAGGSGDDTLMGQEGNDDLRGGGNDDVLMGGFGNDTLDGGNGIGDVANFSDSAGGITLTLNGATDATATGQGTDTVRNIENIVGSAMNDSLTGDSSNNVIEGGDGNDVLNGAGGTQDVLSYANASAGVEIALDVTTQQNTGGAGLDTISNFERINGSVFNDTLFGDGNNNLISGGDGDDIILVSSALAGTAAPGADDFRGEDGNDTIGFGLTGVGQGGAGSGHVMDGGADTDTFVFEGLTDDFDVDLDGESFSDVMTATVISDVLEFENVSAGSGDDVIAGTDDANQLDGNDGADRIVGRAGDDTLNGGAGNDTIFGGLDSSNNDSSGNDIINGGNGDDEIHYVRTGTGAADVDSIDGGADTDTFVLDNLIDSERTVDLTAGVFRTGDLVGTGPIRASLVNVENVLVLSASGVDVRGDAAGNEITFAGLGLTAGENVIEGMAGDDTISAGGGADTVAGGAGADMLDGGDGVDLADYSASAAAVNVNLSTQTGLQGDADGDTLANIENVRGSGGGDTMTGNGEDNTLTGEGGDDVLRGVSGEDLIDGAAGADELSGGNGNDTLDGGSENDTLRGQGDDDTLLGGGEDDDLFGGAGADSLSGGTGADSILGQGDADTIMGDAGNDTIGGGSGNDLIHGGDNDDQLFGNGNNDTLMGEMGNDTLQGAAGLDELFGGDGDDTMTGGDGADLLDGGAGNDTMNGGADDGARDTFVFALGYDLDRINAFDQSGNDRLQLDDDLWQTSGVLTEQQVIDTFGEINQTGSILTLTFEGGDVLEVQNALGIDPLTLGLDVVIV